MDVYIGGDHAGFQIKQDLIPYIREIGHNPIDIGATDLDPKDDYPDLALKLKEQLDARQDDHFLGILICGSGAGVCIAANKLSGIRAATCFTPEQAFFSRLHNDVNVLCLAGLRSNVDSIERVTEGDYQDLIDAGMNPANLNEAKRIVKVFLSTKTEAVSGSRHRRRLDKIADLEKNR